MTKLVVETTGNFQLLGNARDQFARAHRPSVISGGSFVDIHLGSQPPRLRLLGEVDESVTDADLEAFLKSDGTVEDFIATFGEGPAEGKRPSGRRTKATVE